MLNRFLLEKVQILLAKAVSSPVHNCIICGFVFLQNLFQSSESLKQEAAHHKVAAV